MTETPKPQLTPAEGSTSNAVVQAFRKNNETAFQQALENADYKTLEEALKILEKNYPNHPFVQKLRNYIRGKKGHKLLDQDKAAQMDKTYEKSKQPPESTPQESESIQIKLNIQRNSTPDTELSEQKKNGLGKGPK